MICALESPQGFSLSAHTPNYEKFSGVHYQQLASPDLESIWINLIPKKLSPHYPRRDNTNLTRDLYKQYLVFVLVYALIINQGIPVIDNISKGASKIEH